jgi:hypothetical protein
VHRTVGLVALGAALIAACAPPPPPRGPVPPPHEAILCTAPGAFHCNLTWVQGGALGTSATGVAWTDGPATLITITLVLEMAVPKGWVNRWSDQNPPRPLATRLVHDSALVRCEPGTFRWTMRVTFSNRRGCTYHLVGSEFIQT